MAKKLSRKARKLERTKQQHRIPVQKATAGTVPAAEPLPDRPHELPPPISEIHPTEPAESEPTPVPPISEVRAVKRTEEDLEFPDHVQPLFPDAAETDLYRLLDIAIYRATYGNARRDELIELLTYCVTFTEVLERVASQIPRLKKDVLAVTNAWPCNLDGEATAYMEEVWALFRKRHRREGAIQKIIEGKIPKLPDDLTREKENAA